MLVFLQNENEMHRIRMILLHLLVQWSIFSLLEKSKERSKLRKLWFGFTLTFLMTKSAVDGDANQEKGHFCFTYTTRKE